MLQVSVNWLRAHGVDGPDEDVQALADRCEAALELRVGTSLSEVMTEEQLESFEELMGDDSTEAERLAALEAAVPDYKNVVAREAEALKQNIINADDPADYIRNLSV